MIENATVLWELSDGKIYNIGNTGGDGFYFYVPNDYSGDLNAEVFYPGSGCGNENIQQLKNYADQQAPNSIIIMDHSCGGSSSDTLQMISEIEQKYNVSIGDKTNYYGFSAGGTTALQNAVADIQNNPNSAPKTITLFDTAYSGSVLPCDSETISALKQNGSTILMFEGTNYDGGPEAQRNVLALAEAGVPVVIARNDSWNAANESTVGTHSALFNKLVSDNIIGYINGDIACLPDGEDYTFEVYDTETGGWKYITQDELGNYICGGVTNSYINSDFSNLKDIGLFDTAQIMDKYKIDGSLKSEMEYVVECVNNIRSSIMSTNFLSGVEMCTYASTTKIPAREPAFLKQYYKSAGTLLTYMTQESEAMISIAASIDELDQKIGQEASTLNEAIDSILAERGITPDSVNNNASIATSVGSNNGLGVTMAGAGAGAGVVALDALASSEEPYLENVAAHDGDSLVITPTSEEEFINFADLGVNPNRDIIDCGDYKAVYHYDSNGEINGFEHYYNFDSAEEAEENIEFLSEKYRDMEGIDYITIKDKQIKVVFGKECYKKLKAPSMQVLNVMGGE